MSKMKTGAEMIFDMLKPYMNETEKAYNCEDCEYWNEDDSDDEEENEDEEEQYYRYPECECVDGECDQCDHWVNTDYCELDDIYSDDEADAFDDCNDRDYECNQWSSKEHRPTEELSKFIMSVNTVLGGDMGLLVFDKSNKEDMEKIAAIFREYAKRLS